MHWHLRILGSLLALTAATPAFSDWDDHIHTGRCQLSADPAKSRVWPAICFNMKASAQFLFKQNKSEENVGLNLAHVYSSLHINNYFSFHATGIHRRFYFLQSSGSSIIADDSITESLFFQIGNRTLTKISVMLGKMDLPFGVDHRPTMEIYDLNSRNTNYWNFPDFAGTLVIDNQVDARLEVAFSSSDFAFGSEKDNRSKRTTSSEVKRDRELREALAVRASYDFSALEGTRLMASYYEERDDRRQVGIAILNHRANDSQSAFEWVRTGKPFVPEEDFSQLFRLTHSTGFKADRRTVFEFESDSRNYKTLTLGYDIRAFSYTLLQFSSSYNWLEDKDNHFGLGMGVTAQL